VYDSSPEERDRRMLDDEESEPSVLYIGCEEPETRLTEKEEETLPQDLSMISDRNVDT
jgi:hypothetical protein